MTEPLDWNDAANSWDFAGGDSFSDDAFATLLERVVPDLPDWPAISALDFGCGTGSMALRLHEAGARVVALDPARGMTRVLDRKISERALERVVTITSTLPEAVAAAHPALSSGFDLITASSALLFVSEPVVALAAMAELLSTGGRIVHWDWLKSDGQDGFTEERLRALHRRAGLETHFVGHAFTSGGEHSVFSTLMGIASAR